MTPEKAAGTVAQPKELTPENAELLVITSTSPVTAEGHHQNVLCSGG
jgi:hypothetical protein